MISRKMMTKIWCGKFEKCFLEWEKMASRKIFRHFLHANFFMFILLLSNHTVFPVQFGINLHLWVFRKAEIARAEAACAISAFWKIKNSLAQINSKLNSKPYDYLYKLHTCKNDFKNQCSCAELVKKTVAEF